jgi:hypothetical protein
VTRAGGAIPYTLPDGTPLRRGQTENWQSQWAGVYRDTLQSLLPSAGITPTPEQALAARRRATAEANAAIEAMRGALSRPGQPAQTTQPQTGVAPPARTRYDAMGRPITQ